MLLSAVLLSGLPTSNLCFFLACVAAAVLLCLVQYSDPEGGEDEPG